MELTLSDKVPLRAILSTGSQYALLGTRLYSLYQQRNGLARFIKTRDGEWWFHGGMDFASLEERIVKSMLPEIRASQYDAHSRMVASTEKDLVKAALIRKELGALSTDTFDQYLLHHVLGGIDADVGGRIADVDALPQDETEIFTDAEILGKLPLFTTLYPDSALHFHGHQVTIFGPASGSLIMYVRMGKSRLPFYRTIGLDDFLEKYDRRFQDTLSTLLPGPSSDHASKRRKARAIYSQSARQQRALSKARNFQEQKDRIWFEKESNTQYKLYYQIPPFVMHKDDVHYLFRQGLRLRFPIQFRNHQASIGAPLVVRPTRFRHPFVHSGTGGPRSICFAGNAALTRRGVDLGYVSVESLQDKRFARNVIKMINVAERGLTSGYVDRVGPVNYLNPTDYRHYVVQPQDIPPGTRIYYQNNQWDRI